MLRLEKKEIQAIKQINFFKNKEKIKAAFSGGKDSIVLYHLIKRSLLKDIPFFYNNTTIDPPGTWSFIRKYYKDVIKQNPDYSFYQLVEKKGLPNRFQRWCCYYLKENNNIGFDYVFTGVMRSESTKRKNYGIIGQRNDIKEIRPLIDWNANDVFMYAKKYNLKLIKYYYEPYNFARHGCVMCPLSTPEQQIKEAIFFPKHLKALIKSVKKFRKTHRHLDFVNEFKDEYEMIYLWLKQELNKKGKEKISNNLFEFDAKKIIKSFFNC